MRIHKQQSTTISRYQPVVDRQAQLLESNPENTHTSQSHTRQHFHHLQGGTLQSQSETLEVNNPMKRASLTGTDPVNTGNRSSGNYSQPVNKLAGELTNQPTLKASSKTALINRSKGRTLATLKTLINSSKGRTLATLKNQPSQSINHTNQPPQHRAVHGQMWSVMNQSQLEACRG